MIGVVLSPLVPTRGGAMANQVGAKEPQQPSGQMAAPTGTNAPPVPAAPAQVQPSAPAPVRQRLLGAWVAEDPGQSPNRVTFMPFPPNTPDPNPNGGKVEVVQDKAPMLGDFVINGNQLNLQFPSKGPMSYPFEILGDGRLRFGPATYRKV
jgi:hypothetical protein